MLFKTFKGNKKHFQIQNLPIKSSQICSSDRQLQHDLQQRQLDLPPDLELREVLGGDRVRGEADHSGAVHYPVTLLSDLQVLSSPVQRIDHKVPTSYLPHFISSFFCSFENSASWSCHNIVKLQGLF